MKKSLLLLGLVVGFNSAQSMSNPMQRSPQSMQISAAVMSVYREAEAAYKLVYNNASVSKNVSNALLDLLNQASSALTTVNNDPTMVNSGHGTVMSPGYLESHTPPTEENQEANDHVKPRPELTQQNPYTSSLWKKCQEASEAYGNAILAYKKNPTEKNKTLRNKASIKSKKTMEKFHNKYPETEITHGGVIHGVDNSRRPHWTYTQAGINEEHKEMKAKEIAEQKASGTVVKPSLINTGNKPAHTRYVDMN